LVVPSLLSMTSEPPHKVPLNVNFIVAVSQDYKRDRSRIARLSIRDRKSLRADWLMLENVLAQKIICNETRWLRQYLVVEENW